MKIIKYIIVLIMLLEVEFFYLIKMPLSIYKFNNTYQKLLILGIIITGLIMNSKKIIKGKFRYLKIILFLMAIYLIQLIISSLKYNQFFSNTFSISNYYIIPLLYFLIIIYLKRTNDIKFIKKIFINFTIILSTLFILQSVLFKYNIVFLNVNTELTRFGSLRIFEGANIILIGILISFCDLINTNKLYRKKIISIIACSLGLAEMIFVQKTRMAIVAVLIVIVFISCIKFKKNIVKIMGIFISIIVIVILFFSSKIGENYIKSFSLESGNISVRNEAINFFIEETKNEYILGTGFIYVNPNVYDIYNVEKSYKLKGPNGTYYRTDVGIFGFYHTFGILGIIFYLLFVIEVGRDILIIYKIKKYLFNYEILAIFLLIIFTTFSLIITDVYRIITIPFLLSYIEYELWDSKKISR